MEDLDEKQQLSFFRGHLLWQEYLQQPKMPYDLEQVIAGMRAAESGAPIPCDEEKLQRQIRQFQEDLLAKQTRENLADAEEFLAKIAREDTLEIVPNKLYFKRLKSGEGKIVRLDSTPLLTYTVWIYNRHGQDKIISIDTPIPITLRDTISGFSQGVAGMLEGEVRQLFIHPDLAYERHAKFDPNLLVIFKVDVISADHQTTCEANERPPKSRDG